MRLNSIQKSFRPLSWGLSFNHEWGFLSYTTRVVFVPFLGDFLSIKNVLHKTQGN